MTPAQPATGGREPPVRVVTRDNGAGLKRDLEQVEHSLRDHGIAVRPLAFGGNRLFNSLREHALVLAARARGPAEVQLFLERVYPRLLPLARRNLLVPNPEWTRPEWLPLLPRFDAVLCKTRQGERAFAALGCRTVLIGFSSRDCFDPDVPRQRRFLHLAGRSTAKGTGAVVEAWRRHPEWPPLTLVQSARRTRPITDLPNLDHRVGYLPDAELLRLQNACTFHLCPSEAEGFGHYIVEALSTGAVVIGTDGEPMNELVQPDRGLLVAPLDCRPMGQGLRYRIDAGGIEAAVERALALSEAERQRLGAAARAFYLANDRDFGQRLAHAVRGPDPA
ncbi:MAG: glycosyltransferase [Pseudoxanthomonas sp.]